MVDQEGVDILDETETTYANAGAPRSARPLPLRSTEDERISDEWNRTRSQQGEVVGFMGQKPIIRSGIDRDNEDRAESGALSDANTQSEVMAALARLRQLEKD